MRNHKFFGSLARRFVWLALGFVVTLALGGCGQSAQPDQEPSASVGSASSGVQQEAESNFVSSVLADGEITPAEFLEAKDRTITCLAEAGIEASYVPVIEGGPEGLTGSGEMELTPAQISADQECQRKWMGGILELYNSRLVNPNDEDMEVLTVECLIRTGLAPEGFTKNDLRELIERGSVGFGPDTPYDSYEEALLEAQSRPGVTVGPDGTVSALLPSGVPMSDPTAAGCTINPLAYGFD